MREATGSAQSTLALGTRRNYSSLHNRSEHRELTRWPSADVTVGGCSSYIDGFHFLKQGDPEAVCTPPAPEPSAKRPGS